MTEIVRIVPRQPIEARLVDGGCAYFWVDSGGVERAGTPSDWVEVPEPIVWDGSDEALEAINDALPALDQFRRDDFGDGHAWIGRRSGIAYRIRGSVPLMCSVLIVDDSFVILPPEETP